LTVPSKTAWEGHPTPQKKSSKIWLPGTCLCQHVRVYLYKMRRSCARDQGGCVLFQFGCNGVKSSLEGTDKSCAHAAKYLSNQEETTRKGRAGPVSRKGLLYRFASRKAFPHLGLCAERPKTWSPKSCIKLWPRGVIRGDPTSRSQALPGNALLGGSACRLRDARRGRASRSWVPRQEPGNQRETRRNPHPSPLPEGEGIGAARESRNGLIHRFMSRKAFSGRGLCAAGKLKKERESCESSSGFGGYQLCQLRP
jgi:hypothetical protein